MVCKRRCRTCGVLFPTINALHDHCNLTSHQLRPYNCEPCKRAFKTLSALQSHLNSNARHKPQTNDKTPTRAVVAQMDSGGWNAEDDDDSIMEVDSIYGDVHKEWLAECGIYDWGSPRSFGESSAQNHGRSRMFVKEKKCPPAASNNVSKSLQSVSEPTIPSTSSSSRDLHASAGPSSLSKSDEAAARARAALRSRFQVSGVSKLDDAIDLLKSDKCRTGKPEPSAPKLDEGSCSIATESSPNKTNESKLPLNSLFNTTYPFTCPGCRKDFKLFSGFVLHIENRSCKSSVCHEIEDRIYICATQLFGTFTS